VLNGSRPHFPSPFFKHRTCQQAKYEYNFSTILLSFLPPLKRKLNNRNESLGTTESVCTGCDKNTSNVLKTGNHTFIILSRFFFNHAVFSRECYQCLSTHSWKDCDDKRYKVRCLDSQRCIKASGHSSIDEAYVKGCAATCSASDIPVCNEPGVKCNVDCCSSDYCNGAPGHTFSGLLLMACVPIATGVIYLFGY